MNIHKSQLLALGKGGKCFFDPQATGIYFHQEMGIRIIFSGTVQKSWKISCGNMWNGIRLAMLCDIPGIF
jgi:hypothetical protein